MSRDVNIEEIKKVQESLNALFSKKAFQPVPGAPQGGPPTGAMPPQGGPPPGAMPPGPPTDPAAAGQPNELEQAVMSLFQNFEQLIPTLEKMKGEIEEMKADQQKDQQTILELKAQTNIMEKALNQPLGLGAPSA